MKKLIPILLLFTAALPSIAQEIAPTKPQPTFDLGTFIGENASLPASRSGKKEALKVTLRFAVDENGDLDEVKVLKTSGDRGVDDEAVRIVESMPKWKPAMSKGKPVKVYYTLPLKFTLEPEEGNTKADQLADKKEKREEDKEARRESAKEKKDKREEDKEEREERAKERRENKEDKDDGE